MDDDVPERNDVDPRNRGVARAHGLGDPRRRLADYGQLVQYCRPNGSVSDELVPRLPFDVEGEVLGRLEDVRELEPLKPHRGLARRRVPRRV